MDTRADTRRALAIVWAILSLVALMTLVTPLVLPGDTVFGLLPPCESRVATGEPCPLCGMTTAFVALSAGEWSLARDAHPAAPFLYGLFVLNSVAFLASIPRLLRNPHANR